MAVADGWTDKTWRDNAWASTGTMPLEPKSRQRRQARSLKAALSEAGLAEAGLAGVSAREMAAREMSPRETTQRPVERFASRVVPEAPVSIASIEPDEVSTPSRLSSPRLTYFADAQGPAVQPHARAHTNVQSGVVSPPPWVRAARRGRMHSLMLNTFGWTITLIVAGSIVGVAGRYLAVAPPGLEHMQTARQ